MTYKLNNDYSNKFTNIKLPFTVEGIEPTYIRTKTVCLTTWRHCKGM